jgi:hypothetical protein
MALLLAACGGNGDDYAARLRGDAPSTATPTAQPSATPSPTARPMPTETPDLAPDVLPRIEQQQSATTQAPTPVIVIAIISGDNHDATNCQIVDVSPYVVDGQTFTQMVVCDEVKP